MTTPLLDAPPLAEEHKLSAIGAVAALAANYALKIERVAKSG